MIFTNEVEVQNTTPIPVDGSGVTQPVSGSVSVSGSVTVANPGLTDAQLRATPVPVSTTPSVSSTSTITQIAVSASINTTVLAANANRRQAILHISKAGIYVKFGATASATSFTYLTPAANTVIDTQIWTGIIDVFGPACTVTVTELS